LRFTGSLFVYTPSGPKRIELLPWQIITLVDIFGLQLGDEGGRLIKRCFVSIPRKNGKTTFAAIIMLIGLLYAPPGSNLLLAATCRDQARITKEYLEFIISHTPSLLNHFKVLRREIRNKRTEAKLIVLPGDVVFSWGYNAWLVILDELHAFKKPGLWESLTGATVANPESLVIGISTAGQDLTGLYTTKRAYSEMVLTGQISDDSWYTYITTKNDDILWHDDLAIEQANPGLNKIVPASELFRLRDQAKLDAQQELYFRRYHLNEQVSEGATFIALDLWKKQEIDSAKGEVDLISFGVDLSLSTDLSAVVISYYDKARTIINIEAHAWITSKALNESIIASELINCRDSGELTICEGEKIDFSSIANFIASRWVPGKSLIYIDPYPAHLLIDELEKKLGIYGADIIEVKQSGNAIDQFIRKAQLLANQYALKHTYNRLFEICISNTVVRENKKGQLTLGRLREKVPIDLSVALVMSLIPAVDKPSQQSGPLVESWIF